MHKLTEEYGVRFTTDPWKHQAASLLLALSNPAFMFLLDMGTGKTKIVLDVTQHRTRQKQVGKTLILVPSAINIQGWKDEIDLHTPDLKYVPLLGSKADREQLLRKKADLYLLNYAGLQSFMTEHDKKKRARIPIKEKVDEFCSHFDQVIFDESHLLGNHQTLVYNLCYRISRATRYRYGLTGTPFGRDPMLLWSQFDLIDHGQTLGQTLGIFRAAFFAESQNFWGGMEYNFKKRMEDKLASMLRHRSIRYDEKECQDLPEKVPIVRRVPLPAETETYYKKIVEKLRAAHGNHHEVENAFLMMRQLTSGFLSMKGDDEEDPDKIEVELTENPKLEALQQLLAELPESKKVVVVHVYNYTGARICEMLKAEGISHSRVKGGNPEEQLNEIAAFKKDPKKRVLVWNAAVGQGSGANLQVAHYMVMFESPVSPIIRQQLEKRVHRGGQTETTFIIDLVVQNSVDERILEFVKEGRDLFESICDGSVKL